MQKIDKVVVWMHSCNKSIFSIILKFSKYLMKHHLFKIKPKKNNNKKTNKQNNNNNNKKNNNTFLIKQFQKI